MPVRHCVRAAIRVPQQAWTCQHTILDVQVAQHLLCHLIQVWHVPSFVSAFGLLVAHGPHPPLLVVFHHATAVPKVVAPGHLLLPLHPFDNLVVDSQAFAEAPHYLHIAPVLGLQVLVHARRSRHLLRVLAPPGLDKPLRPAQSSSDLGFPCPLLSKCYGLQAVLILLMPLRAVRLELTGRVSRFTELCPMLLPPLNPADPLRGCVQQPICPFHSCATCL
mmetsp:Transcript_29465/g.84331  ORF Transcript_29465/g.84331 Transcript_29465/m.84331 type:complete len:220 (-) Transcript_29465:77-736(-)